MIGFQGSHAPPQLYAKWLVCVHMHVDAFVRVHALGHFSRKNAFSIHHILKGQGMPLKH